MEEVRLFVYGTLKRGFPAERYLQEAQFQGTATTAPGYALHDLGAYPGLIVAAGAGTVSGELYSVSPEDLTRLDRYEGADYSRERIVLSDGSVAEAYVTPASSVAGTPRIEGGVWTAKGRGSADF